MSTILETTSTTSATSKTAITVGGVRYDIDITKIPYLSSFVNCQASIQPQSTQVIHEPILCFDLALKGIELGYRQCFRSLPADLSEHHALCDTYHFLHVDVLGGQSINEIFIELKSGVSDYDLEERREIRGDKSKARDAAFKLLYLILLGDFADAISDSMKVFKAVIYVVSHSATFKWRTRSVVRAAYEERFVVTAKQKASLDKWEKDPDKLAVEDAGDVTTEELL